MTKRPELSVMGVAVLLAGLRVDVQRSRSLLNPRVVGILNEEIWKATVA